MRISQVRSRTRWRFKYFFKFKFSSFKSICNWIAFWSIFEVFQLLQCNCLCPFECCTANLMRVRWSKILLAMVLLIVRYMARTMERLNRLALPFFVYRKARWGWCYQERKLAILEFCIQMVTVFIRNIFFPIATWKTFFFFALELVDSIEWN